MNASSAPRHRRATPHGRAAGTAGIPTGGPTASPTGGPTGVPAGSADGIRPGAAPGVPRRRAGALLVGLCLALAACGPATLPPGDRIDDVHEARNRAAHEVNLGLDRALLGPSSDAYGSALPDSLREGVANFASNLNQPSYVLNNLLQARLGRAAQNTLRFAINSTIGIGGLFDPATALGVPADSTDFGETLHLYGFGEGDYIVHPVLGPSTTRDTVGMVVDFALNPVRHLADPPDRVYVTGARLASGLGSRYQFGGTVDSILYDSADSYAQLRSLYLQQRRFELGGDDGAGYEDPYADAAAAPAGLDDPYFDPYADPYLDPYAP